MTVDIRDGPVVRPAYKFHSSPTAECRVVDRIAADFMHSTWRCVVTASSACARVEVACFARCIQIVKTDGILRTLRRKEYDGEDMIVAAEVKAAVR
jgi:hypothetical protein